MEAIDADGDGERNGSGKEHGKLRTATGDVTVKDIESDDDEEDEGEKRYESDGWMRSGLGFQGFQRFQRFQ